MSKPGILALVAAVSACGKVTTETPDAPDDPPDAAPAVVKVTTLTHVADGLPDPTAKVIFQDPEGNVVFDGQVDAMGKLEAPLPRGGTVTEIRVTTDTATTLSAQISTITGVKPGDDLTFGVKARATDTAGGGQTTMTASYTPVNGATSHVFFTTCGSASGGTTSPVTLTFRDSCHGNTFDLVGVASGGTVTTPRFFRLLDVAYQSGGSFTVPVGFGTMSQFTVDTMNVPAEISSMTVQRSSLLDNAAVATQSLSLGDPAPGTVTSMVPYPPTVGTRAEVVVSMARTGATGSQLHEVHTPTVASSIDIDLDRQRVPWLTTIAPNATGMSWSTVVPGDAPDGMLTLWNARWVANNRTTLITWRIAHPASANGVTLPRLPPAYAAFDPQAQTATVSPNGTQQVSAVDYDILTGYDQFRQQPATLLFSPVDDMGALMGMAFQRRRYSAAVFVLPPPPPPP